VSEIHSAGTAATGQSARATFAVGLARAFAGAILFSLPMLMTMEMWELGFYADRLRLALLLFLTIPLLVGLSHYMGFEETFGWLDDAVDAFVALAVASISSVVALGLFGVINAGMASQELVGTVAIQAVPASIGAALAQSQLGGGAQEKKNRHAGYGGGLFIMAAGALFLSLNVAPTEEVVLIAHKMTPWHSLGLAVASLAIMHAFVYAVEFHGQISIRPHVSWPSEFLRFTIVGYVVVLLISLYILWTFGRTTGMAWEELLAVTIVLGFPAAIGAAAARLIL
jgi:putative integral membrane protein (TIGR02587 family)